MKIKNLLSTTCLLRQALLLILFVNTIFVQAQPSVGMGLGGNNYFLTYHMFADAMKSVRWVNVASWDANGFPTAANSGTTVIGRIGVDTGASLPDGQYVLTWEGEGEVQFNNSVFTLVSEDLTSNPKRRVYDVTTNSSGIGVRVLSFPATNIKLWIPGRENHSSLWNPDYLCYMEGFRGGVMRFMDLNETNFSEQSVWADRTPRNWSTYVNDNNLSTAYNVNGAVSYEAMIELANEMDSDMWICIPHLADDDYISNLAHLIKTGVDLATGEQTTQPLNANLDVWLEYSNEVWNFNFSQTNWVLNNCPGANLDERYALKSVDVFNTFRTQFDDDSRIVRILATQTANAFRTYQRVNAVNNNDFDAVAITTYFSYDYADYIYQNWNGGSLSQADFYNHISTLMGTGVFQTTETAGAHQGTAYAYEIAADAGKYVVSYEGNEHFNPNRRVDTSGNGTADTELYNAAPGSLAWIHDFARSSYIYDLLEQYQLRHEVSGLQTHVPFVAVRGWSATGQWGYAEVINQDINVATKYRWLHDHYGLSYPSPTGGPTCLSPALPVEILSFSGKKVNAQTELSWTTVQELNNQGFEVQHSKDGREWIYLDFVQSQEESSGTNDYNYVHQQPFSGRNYYRLRQLDIDGSSAYSDIVEVKFEKRSLAVFPNPVKSGTVLQVRAEGENLPKSEVRITDSAGRTLQLISLAYGANQVPLIDLQKGIYYLTLISEGEVYQEKIVVE